MSLAELLVERKLANVLIIDDAYDQVPRAEDLSDDGAWANFFDDIGQEAQRIAEVFPAYATLDADSLRTNDEFVAAVWSLRNALDPTVSKPFFESYEQAVGVDRTFLSALEGELTKLGLTTIKSGREIPEGANNADIIFADLFLGASQQDPDMERSIKRINELLHSRHDKPPLVILMSRSELLKDRRTEFRDRAGLLGAMFRVYSKKDLVDGVTLFRAIERLASYYPDALRVAAFVRAWEQGLANASARFMAVVRRLDLPDYAQIHEILLEFEGQPLGSYLLDVFDRVLQHEIEADKATISTAATLNAIDTKRYSAPHISGSPDLQELAYRSIWQQPERLAVKGTVSGAPVSFGDLLLAKNVVDVGGQHALVEPQALVVLTAACDLVRGGSKRVLLMGGTLAELQPGSWISKDNVVRTPIVIFADGRRWWIRWSLKDLQLLAPTDVSALIAGNGPYAVTHRLRESHALELQQHLLADMGRVGVIAQMPGTFPVTIEASTVASDGTLRALDVPTLRRDGGVCYTGRAADGNEYTVLMVTEEGADELAVAISALKIEDTHTKAKGALERLKGSSFLSDLLRGVKLSESNKRSWTNLKARLGDADVVVGLIARNPDKPLEQNTLQQSGSLVLVLKDVVAEDAAPQAQAVDKVNVDDANAGGAN